MRTSRDIRWLVVVLLWSLAAAANASFHFWRINELYSNADGTIQFIEFREIAGANGENFLADHTLVGSGGTFTFPTDLPSFNTARKTFIVGTQGFANLGIVAPDYIIPTGFLSVGGGTLQYGAMPSDPYGGGPVDVVSYPALPTDGTSSIDRNGTLQTNSPMNFAGTIGTIAAAAPVSPQTGWWWNASESGRGFFIERQGANLVIAGYLYADDGRALWVLSGGPMTGSSAYSGSLLTFSGGQSLTGPYQAPVAAPSLGTLSLQFSDSTHGTLTWPGGTVAIERFPYAAPPLIAGAPENGWWWYAAENGRGFSLEVQGSVLFIAGYMYDTAGNPIWYLSVGTMSSGSLYQGPWTQFAGGQALAGPYRPPTQVNANVGALTIQFSDAQNGMMTLPDGRMIPITRLRF